MKKQYKILYDKINSQIPNLTNSACTLGIIKYMYLNCGLDMGDTVEDLIELIEYYVEDNLSTPDTFELRR